MRFMILMKSDETAEAGVVPDEHVIGAMLKYNEDLVKAGVLLAAEGLRPSAHGARVKFEGDRVRVTEGPFSEAKELIAGFWVFQVKSKEEAIEWVRRIPNPGGGAMEVEIRQVFDGTEFDAVLTPALREQENRLRAQVVAKR